MNSCEIKLIIDSKGFFSYNVKIYFYDEVDYVNKYYIKREKDFYNISHEKIKNFLYDLTEKNQNKKIKILEKIWQLGKKEPFIKFDY